ncbi:L-serine ammonia-lyase [Rhodopirellula sp. P2]|uniref:L-serine ammonia-lyase n=1 Tax=Rhodopirellula sp. P2 TaxID=2127060 RepID=UPI00236845E8|nr:L-serine ammonia-lyase [Rhodopirellula sp. P2]WDQ18141.1 L-serine ammonia-lyase [Rhodopirellula sp. P2]
MSHPAKPAETLIPYFGVFDLFKIGIGPSSSHSVGPMRAAEAFLKELQENSLLQHVSRIQIDLYGSLALTGLGHQTDVALLMGMQGETPDQIDTSTVTSKLASIRESKQLALQGNHPIHFCESTDLVMHRRAVKGMHPNTMRFSAFTDDAPQTPAIEATFLSIGGGFIHREGQTGGVQEKCSSEVPYPFTSANEVLQLCEQHQISINELALRNELTFRSQEEIRAGLQRIWTVMQECVKKGCHTEGILPGGLEVERRAPALFQSLTQRSAPMDRDALCVLDWVDLYALAVNEENAAGGRVVTAPTNGAAGIIPAVLHYLQRFCPDVTDETIERFLLTAAVIGSLYKRNASISGAEVGCQGEVGVACSMAAGALTDALGGTPHQVEEAAEIGMEHNLGLTCDPIKGLVQVPCIERNAMGAVKAINASRLALRGDGKHFVSLDRVIRVMKRTGADMSARYKETSRGGLAVNISEC